MERTQFSSQVPPSSEEVSKVLEAGLPGLDLSRRDGLAQLGQVRDAKARGLSREQTLLTLKHGGAQHARIDEARQRFKVNEHFRREIAVVRELTETPAPEMGKDTMIVHGFVRRRSDHTGLPGLTLALTDAEGTWIREFGFACTDQRGYFLLAIKARGAQGGADEKPGDIKSGTGVSVDEARREAEAKAAAAARGESKPAAADIPPGREFQLRVFDSEGRGLHTDARPVVLRPGGVDYRYILLGDDAAKCACTPPPEKSGGKPSPTGPRVPPGSPPPTPVTPRPTPTPVEPRVSSLKSYEQPAPGTATPPGTPLETIRGIGPKSAEKLRQAGIADVEEYLQTPGAEFVKVAGFDKTAPKSARTRSKPAIEPADKPAPEKKAAARKRAATGKTAAKKKTQKKSEK